MDILKDDIILVIGALADNAILVLDPDLKVGMDERGRIGYKNASNDIITGDMSLGTLGSLLETYDWHLC